jgi:hypothetical protein
MIASPGDVSAERDIVRDVLREWNDLHAEERGIVLLPLGWETHSAPSMVGTAQEIINGQVLRRSDLLIGIFWTRIGTATAEAISGTVEEIEKHVAASKDAMILLPNAPVKPSRMDREQYEGVQQFRAEFQKRGRGLYAPYASRDDFRDQFRRHLALTVSQHPMFQHLGGPTPEPAPTVPPEPVLSAEARELLLAAAASNQGYILTPSTLGGSSVQAGNREFTNPGNPRSRALWEAALNELVERRLVKSVGYEGKAFRITADGYRFADTLRETAPSDTA